MKALFQGNEFYIVEDDGDGVLLEPLEGDEDQRFTVSYGEPTLIIDPSDGELDAAKAWRESVPKSEPFVPWTELLTPKQRQRIALERIQKELKEMPAHDLEIGIAINAIGKALQHLQPPYTTVERINE